MRVQTQIEENGLKGYLGETKFVQDWPTLNPVWDSSTFSLKKSITRYAELLDSKLGLPYEFYILPSNSSNIVAYRTFLVETAVALGANRSTAEQDVLEFLNLEAALSRIKESTAYTLNMLKLIEPMTLSQLSTKYPDTVINMCPNYLGNLSIVLGSFSNRTIQNLFGFKYALSRVGGLTKRIRQIEQDFQMGITGTLYQMARSKYCLNLSSTKMWKAISKLFVNRTFTEQDKNYMGEMVDNLMTAFRQILNETTVMGQTTKEAAYKKLAAMDRKIGYPDTDFTDEDVDQKYKDYNFLEKDFYANQNLLAKLSSLENMAYLRKPVDNKEWIVRPHLTNAYYRGDKNEIIFPAAILQPPAFSLTFQNAINYGAIGAIIGHEITHGFYTIESKFNTMDWWQKSDYEVLQQRAQCLIDQYSGFHFANINMSVDGNLTLNENMADNGGIKESFRIIGTLQNSEDFAKAYNCPRGSYMNPDKKCSVW